MALSPRFEFPGIPAESVIAANYSLGHGITPGVITVEVPAGKAKPRQEGACVFTFGSTTLRIDGCKVDTGQSRIGQGQIWTYSILDGRWPWQYGYIIGHYNIRRPDGRLRELTEKTPQELAKMLLEEMHVTSFDVSKMENTRRPEIHWSYENPAQALATLADEVGCRVVYRIDKTVAILPAGEGASLPNYAAQSIDFTMDTAQIPSGIIVVGAESTYQTRWDLEAVGLDDDGQWKLIDDLSYKPTNGWEEEDPETMGNVAEQKDATKPNPRALALQTVWRCYRIKASESGGPLGDGTFEGIDTLPETYRGYLPLSSGLIDIQSTETSDEDGVALERKPKPPFIRGKFFDSQWLGANVEDVNYKGQVSVDGENGIIMFDKPIYIEDDGDYVEAEIVVEVAHPIRRADRELERPTWVFPLTGSSTVGKKVLMAPDLKYTVKVLYDLSNAETGKEDNRTIDKLDEQAEYLAKTFLASLSTVESGDRSYPGLIDTKTDGAISQVSWSIGRGPAMTRVSRNSEHDADIIPPFKERRRKELSAKFERDLADAQETTAAYRMTSGKLEPKFSD